jgi:hypothetical protein
VLYQELPDVGLLLAPDVQEPDPPVVEPATPVVEAALPEAQVVEPTVVADPVSLSVVVQSFH